MSKLSIEARLRLAGDHDEVRLPGAWAHEAAGQIEHMKRSLAVLLERATQGRVVDPLTSLAVVKLYLEEAVEGDVECPWCDGQYEGEFDDVPSLADLAGEAGD